MIIYDPKITGSFQINGSTISSVGEIDNLSGSVAALNNASSSYLLNTTDVLNGNLTVTGTLTAQEFHTEYTSASIVYQSGSTKFGDSSDDVHEFTGSVKMLNVTGPTSGSFLFTGGQVTISGDDADLNLDITSGSSVANLSEIRFRVDGGTMGRLYMHKGTKHMYLGPTYFPTSSLYLQDGTGTVMSITGSSVGIGTASPASKLHVLGSGTGIIRAEGANGDGGLDLKSTTQGTWELRARNFEDRLDIYSSTLFSTVATFHSSGNVGIGTTSPTGTYGKLTVNGSISLLDDQNTKLEIGRYSAGVSNSYIKLGANSNSLRITNNTDTADLLYINNDGSILIGQATKRDQEKFAVVGTTANYLAEIRETGTGGAENSGLLIYYPSSAPNSRSKHFLLNADNTATKSFLSSDGGAYFSGDVGIGDSTPNFVTSGRRVLELNGSSEALMSFAINGSWQYYIQTTTSGIFHSTGGKDFVIDPGSSNVGIGITSPQHKLDIQDSTATILLRGTNNSVAAGDVQGSILFYNNDASTAGGARVTGAIKYVTQDAFGRHALVFGTSTTDAKANFGDPGTYTDSTIERMRISHDGNVTIGGGPLYSGTGVTSLSINNDQYPALSLGSLSASRMALISYSSYNLFTSSNPFVFDTSSPVYINSTSNAGASARLSIFNNDTQEGLAIKMAGTTPYSPLAIRNQDNNYMFQVSQTGEVRINDAGIGINETLRIKGVETALRTYGSQTGYTQGAIVISSGTDSSPGARGQGIFYFNEGNDITWYSGGLYQSADRFDICRKTSTTSIDSSTAQSTYSLFHLNNGGSAYNATGTWGTISSDQRLKENIVNATPKLDDVMSLQVRNFNYIGKEEKYIGFIAQELEQVFPSLVTTSDMREFDRDGNVVGGLEDTKGVKVGMDFAILVKAIQEQQAIIEDLKARIQTLENS